MRPVTFLIADDHDIVRRGLRLVLEENKVWKVVAEARNGIEAAEKTCEHKPDIAVLDFSMPKLNGLDAAHRILKNAGHTKVLIFTVHDNDEVTEEMRRAGIHGYVRKSAADRDLMLAIKAILNDGTYYPDGLPLSAHASRKGRRKLQQPLTARQKEVVRFIAQGFHSDKIAEALGISAKTTETHKQNILRRINCHSIAELVRYAIRNEIIQP